MSQNGNSIIIHPTAIIEKGAIIGEQCSIGPYCIVGKDSKLGNKVELISHAVVTGHTSIGTGTVIFPFASIGHVTQDKKYSGEESYLIIGKSNKIREYVTIQPGTKAGTTTKVGDNNLFMASSHVAHDCIVGDSVVMANNAVLAGHVTVGNNAIIGGLSAVRQFVRIGENAMIAGKTGVANDVIPFGLVEGRRGQLCGLNIIGMKRSNMPKEEIFILRQIYRELFYAPGIFSEKIQKIAQKRSECGPLDLLIKFLLEKSLQGYTMPKDKIEPETKIDSF